MEFLQTTFLHLTIIADKKVEDGCSRRRPDVLVDFGDQVLCVEIDENMHTGYDCSCENKRLMELSQDVGHRPMVFVRFNPDSYKNEKSELVRSPWVVNKTGLCVVKKTGTTEWAHRLAILQEHVQYWVDHRTEKTVEIVELFYDMTLDENEEGVDEEKEETGPVDDGTAAGGAGV